MVPANTVFVELDKVGRKFNGVWAIHNLSARIEPGSVIAVLGANGAGKSTLLRLLGGWLPLSEGAIRFDGSPLRPTAIHLRRRVMLLDESTKSQACPIDVLAQAIKDYRAERSGIEDEVARWFDELDVTKVYSNRENALSKGQKYKMLMTGLFVIKPPIWLLDEPFSSGLDAHGLKTLEEQVRIHSADGGTVIFSSQWPEHARRMASRALVLDDGKLVWDAPPTHELPRELLNTVSGAVRSVLQELGHAP
jgi:ABC-type multidrug transport system ATPase subunit